MTTILPHNSHYNKEIAEEYIAGLPDTEKCTIGKTNVKVISHELFPNSFGLWQTNAEIEFDD